MKRIKFYFLSAVLIGVMFIFYGCAYYDTSLDFEFKGDYMADKYVDLLIPIDETDERYIDYNCNIKKDRGNSEDDLIIEIPEDSEIVNYNKKGYRSMLMHMRDAHLYVMTYDSENCPDYSKKYNGIPYEIKQNLFLPHEWTGKYPPYGEGAFLEFCEKYKKCYAAVFDKDGNILQISKKISLVSLGNFYINDTTFYDVKKNKIEPHYIRSSELVAFQAAFLLLIPMGTIGCIITLIVDKIRQNKLIVSYKWYIMAASVFNVPTVLYVFTSIYCAFGLSISIAVFFLNLIKMLLNIGIFAIAVFVNVGVLKHFIIYEKKLRRRALLEEKYREEKNSDIS